MDDEQELDEFWDKQVEGLTTSGGKYDEVEDGDFVVVEIGNEEEESELDKEVDSVFVSVVVIGDGEEEIESFLLVLDNSTLVPDKSLLVLTDP